MLTSDGDAHENSPQIMKNQYTEQTMLVGNLINSTTGQMIPVSANNLAKHAH